MDGGSIYISPTCFFDGQTPTAQNEDNRRRYPFENDCSMQLADIFQILATILGLLSGVGAIVAYTIIDERGVPVTDPCRWVPALVMIVTGLVNIFPLILFHSETLCHNVSQSHNTSDTQPFALIIVQPHCYVGGGAYCSIKASILWIISAQALLLPHTDVPHEWDAIPTNHLKPTREMTAPSTSSCEDSPVDIK
jgi:hypothetical protein